MNNLPWFLTSFDPYQDYLSGRYVVLDFETDNKSNGSALDEDNDIILVCWQVVHEDGRIEKKHLFAGQYEMGSLLDDIREAKFIVAQNAKFELQWLKRAGLDLRSVLVYDTLLAAWVIDGNRRRPRNLNALARRYGLKGKVDLVSKLISKKVNPRDIHPEWLLTYCHQDVEVTRQVFLAQCEELTSLELWHLVYVRNLCCSVLADIEFEGLTLDAERVKQEYNKALDTIERLETKLNEMTGGINLGSPAQLSSFVYDKLNMALPLDHKGKPILTDKGQKTANAKVIPLLKPETEEQKEFLTLYKEYNKAVSLVEKNLEYFQLTCEQKNCTFRGEIRQAVVQTGRLASSGIPTLFEGKKKEKSLQLQNIPREFKRLFCSGDDDYLIGEADGSQLEFRVAADICHDRVAYREIADGVDIHSFTAHELTAAGEPTTRQEAKASTFRPLYGGGSGSPALVAYCEYFKDKYKGITATQREWQIRCVNDGMFTTPYGMKFYFPGTKMQRSGYIINSTSICNFPVQGGATGEIIPIALVYFWHRIKDKPIRMFSTIHDSMVSRVRKDVVEEYIQISKQALTYDVYDFLKRIYNWNFKVPLGLGVKVAPHWGDTKEEIKYDVFPSGKEIQR